MKEKLQSLLTIGEDGKVEGAMSPVLFINEMAKQLEFKPHIICRVWLPERMHNFYEEPGKKGLTGHDTLLAAQVFKNDIQAMLFVDEGSDGLAVATRFKSDPESELIITPIYEKRAYEQKLDSMDINEIFNELFANPEKYLPKKKAA